MALSFARNELRRAGRRNETLAIVYRRKFRSKDGTEEPEDLISRRIQPYEIKDGKVYATDDEHYDRTHSFIINRLSAVNRTGNKFEPIWPIQLSETKAEESAQLTTDIGERWWRK